MPLKFGIAGFGAMGRWHAGAIEKTPGLKLHSVFDITPDCRKDAEREYGCAAFDDLAAFTRDPELDAVVVATPSHVHVEPTLTALRAGKPVLCEKPLVTNEKDAKKLFAAAEKAGLPLMTFQNRRFDGHFRLVRKLVDEGRLGELLDLRLTDWVYSDLMKTFGVKSYRPGWRSEAAYGGGVLLDFGPHYCDQLLQLIPAPVASVYAVMERRRWSKDAEDQFTLVVRFTNGATGIIEVMHAAFVPQARGWRINGTQGGFTLEEEVGHLLTAGKKGKMKQAQRKPPVDDWLAMYKNFRDVLKGTAEMAVQPAETLRLMMVLDAARKSAASGRVVTINDVYAPRTPRRRAAKAS